MRIGLALLLMHALGVGDLFAAPGDSRVCTWKGDRRAAVTLTYDDPPRGGFKSLRDFWAPRHRWLQIPGTVGVVTGTVDGIDQSHWEQLREMHREGWLDFAAHTNSHPHLPELGPEAIESEFVTCNDAILALTGVRPQALIYPFGEFNLVVQDIARRHYVGARSVIEGFNSAQSDDYFAIKSQGIYTRTLPSELDRWFETAISESQWLVIMSHSVQGIDDGWEPASPAVYSRMFELTRKHMNRGEIWADHYEKVALYLRERNSTDIHSTKTGEAIEVSLTFREDLPHSLYNYPLTISTEVPDDWVAATVIRPSGETEFLTVLRSAEGRNFVRFDLIPGAGTAQLRKTM